MVSGGNNLSDRWILQLFADVPFLVFGLVSLIIISLCAMFLLRLWQRRQLLRETYVLLELTPPFGSERTKLATNRLINVLHQLAHRNFINTLVHGPAIMSLEVVSSRTQGIRFMIYVAKTDVALIKRDIVAYLPGVRCTKVKTRAITSQTKYDKGC